MKQRCTNPRHRQFKHYGGRGISLDPKWRTFVGFYEDMGDAPLGRDIDRIDNNAGYCKANCRWTTRQENENNKRNNVVVEYRGERFTVAQLARRVGSTHDFIYKRLQRGWSVDRAVETPSLRR